MSKKWAYFFATLFLLVLRFGVLNTDLDEQMTAMGHASFAQFIADLKQNPAFGEFVGSYAMPVFVVVVMVFWITSDDDQAIPMQFLALPVFYIPFSIIGAILATAEFRFSYLWIHPLVILPFGYFYVSMWTIFIWFLEKCRILST